MSLLAVGSIALDTVETPSGRRENALGGSAAYFSWSASLQGPVRLVGVVGDDYPVADFICRCQGRGIDPSGLEVVKGGKTFSWHGRYSGDLGAAETLRVDLNVFGDFDPKIPAEFRKSDFVFLANGSPVLQARVLDQVGAPRLAVADTMNLWIERTPRELTALLGRVQGIILNHDEIRQYTGEKFLVRAGRRMLELGPRFVVIKKGEHGASLVTRDFLFSVPCYPTEKVVDTTGAGDSFAGGFMGFLARSGRWEDPVLLKQALLWGTVHASFNIESFSFDRLDQVTPEERTERYEALRRMITL